MAQVENEACCKDDGDDVWIASCHLSASTLLVLFEGLQETPEVTDTTTAQAASSNAESL